MCAILMGIAITIPNRTKLCATAPIMRMGSIANTLNRAAPTVEIQHTLVCVFVILGVWIQLTFVPHARVLYLTSTLSAQFVFLDCTNTLIASIF